MTKELFAERGWTFRRASVGDVAAIRDWVRAVYAKYVSRMGRESKPMTADYRLAIENHQVWVVCEADEIVAVLELIASPEAFTLENIAVSERLQGQGVGGKLLDFAESEARRQGYAEILLFTNENMGDNAALYSHRGYEETHREPMAGGAVVYMRKMIAPSD